MFDKAITNKFLKALENIEYGQFDVVTPDGKLHAFAGDKPGPHGTLIIKDWRVIPNLAWRGDIGFAEDYRDGKWDADDLANLLWVGLQNSEAINPYLYGGMFARALTHLSYLTRLNTINGSKRNIHAHYDLGNAFYKLWLDPSMTYSAAIYRQDNEFLQQAQHNKYDRIIDVLNKNSGSLLEIGCGWGGFADRAMERGDYNIKAITISNEQHQYASDRLQGKASVALEDYRHQEGKYDSLVSIEMFEAVGEQFWPTYFHKVKSLLASSGQAIIQTITIRDELFESYRRGGDMVRSFIFPGGMLPSPSRFIQEAGKAGLQVTDRYDFGQDYAKTLEQWLASFEQQKQQVIQLGFDEAFIRLWRFYLAACIASFKTKRTNVMQVALQHA